MIKFWFSRIFLTDLYGNPNKRNARNETALHLACKLSLNAPPSAQDRRLACVQLILQWKGGFDVTSGTIEQADLKAQDMVEYLRNLKYIYIIAHITTSFISRMVIQLYTPQLVLG